MNAKEALNIPGVRVGPLFEMDLDKSATIEVYALYGGVLSWRFKSDKSGMTECKTRKFKITSELKKNNLNNLNCGVDLTA
jgi:hypothetical protein